MPSPIYRSLATAVLLALTLALSASPAYAADSLARYETPARAFWHGGPTAVTYAWFTDATDPFAKAWCEYDAGMCGVKFCAYGDQAAGMWVNSDCWARDNRFERCRMFLHEWGHLTIAGGDPDHAVLNRPDIQVGMQRTCRGWAHPEKIGMIIRQRASSRAAPGRASHPPCSSRFLRKRLWSGHRRCATR